MEGSYNYYSLTKNISLELGNVNLALSDVCRLCGECVSDLIPIYGVTGNDLRSQISEYLPVKIVESDDLPHNVCHECAMRLKTWHDFAMKSLEIDKQLRDFKTVECFEDTIQMEIKSGRNEFSESSPVSENEIEDNFCLEENHEETISLICHDPKWVKFEDGDFSVSNCIGDVECPSCETKCPSRKELTLHLFAEHSIDVRYCEKCDKIYHAVEEVQGQLPDDLVDLDDNHDLTSDGEKLLNCSNHKNEIEHLVRDVSNPVFSPEGQLEKDREKHKMTIIEPNDTSHSASEEKVSCKSAVRCDVCKRTFTCKGNFVRHYRIHTDERPFACDRCGKSFRYRGGLVRHLNDVHYGIKRFVCEICGRCFTNKETLENHTRTHTGERPFICHCCGRGFKSRAVLMVHFNTHSDTFALPCPHCPKRLRSQWDLMNHLDSHSGEKSYICEICGKLFGVRAQMLRHKLIHAQGKGFVCPICGLIFNQKRYLRRHEKCHSTKK